MTDLIILGTDVHGMEMAAIIQRINAAAPTWNLLGYAAAKAEHVGTTRGGYPVMTLDDAINKHPSAMLVADNEFPRNLAIPTDRLATLVDPSTFVAPTARIGPGCVIYPNGFIGHNAQIGQWVFILSGSVVNHDDVLEDRVTLATGVTLAGYVRVEADCYVGQASTVRQYLRIGRDSLVGMGAVVVRDVEPGSVMVGNPARRLRGRRDK